MASPNVVTSRLVSIAPPLLFDRLNMRSQQSYTTLHSWPPERFLKVMLGCMLKRIFCPSSRINLFNFSLFGTYTLPLNLNTPSDPIINSLACSIPSNPTVFHRLGSSNCFSLIRLNKSLDIVKLLHLMKFTFNSTYILMSLNFFTSSHSLIIMWDTCIVFLLRASATTFTFLVWYKSSKS